MSTINQILKIVKSAKLILDRSNVEIAGRLYDEIVTNVPGAIIETSVGEPGELTQPFRSRAFNEFLKFRIVFDMRKGMNLISLVLILLYLPLLLDWALS